MGRDTLSSQVRNNLLSRAMWISVRVDKMLPFLPYRVKTVEDLLVRWSTTISRRGREHHQHVEKGSKKAHQ
jgi:hypothetical protein